MSSPTTHRRARAGTEPANAQSPLGLRFRMSLAAAPAFLVLGGLLAWGAAETEPSDTQTVIAVLSAVCCIAFLVALADAVHLGMTLRRAPHRHA
jgi:hypothetical protein